MQNTQNHFCPLPWYFRDNRLPQCGARSNGMTCMLLELQNVQSPTAALGWHASSSMRPKTSKLRPFSNGMLPARCVAKRASFLHYRMACREAGNVEGDDFKRDRHRPRNRDPSAYLQEAVPHCNPKLIRESIPFTPSRSRHPYSHHLRHCRQPRSRPAWCRYWQVARPKVNRQFQTCMDQMEQRKLTSSNSYSSTVRVN